METIVANGFAPGEAQLDHASLTVVLTRILERMDRMEQALHGLTTVAAQAPGLLAMAGDMLDEGYRTAAASGVDLEARGKDALQLLERLTQPQTIALVDQLLDLASQAPGLLAMVGDTVDDAYRSAANAGIDVEIMVKQGGMAAQRLSDLMRSPEFGALMDSGMLDPRAVALLGKAAGALIASRQQPLQPLGPFALFTALRDPDVQKALGFFVSFAKAFGKTI